MDHEPRKSPVIVPLLIIIGGALIIVSYFPKWGRVTSLTNGKFLEVKGGTPVLIAGIVAVVLGLLLAAFRSRGARIAISIVTILGGLLAILIAVLAGTKSNIRNTVADEVADQVGQPHATIEQQFAKAEGTQIKTSDRMGFYLGLGGSVLVLIGGIGGLVTGRSRPVAEVGPGEATYGAPPPPPSGAGTDTMEQPQAGTAGSGPVPPPPPPASSEPASPPVQPEAPPPVQPEAPPPVQPEAPPPGPPQTEPPAGG